MKTLFTLLLVTFATGLFAQDYYVLQVKGKVKNTKTGKFIKTNDVVKADEQLAFSSATDAVAVVSAKAGRFVIKPGKPNKSNEFMAYVKDALSQANNRLSTRSGIFLNVLDFKTYFDKHVFLLPELQYKVSGQSFPINSKSFFFIRYVYKGEEINKQLRANTDSLLIVNREELFKVDGKPVSPAEAKDFQLFYYNETGTLAITPLHFTTTDPSIVKGEIDVLKKTLTSSKTSPSKIKDEIIAYLQENYGKVEEGNVNKWLK